MKRFIFTLIFILLVSILGYSQTVSAPDSKSFTQSTNAQDGSGFSLSGFNSTATLLASISLVNPPSGTSFYLNTASGLTAASGFTLSGNKTRLVVTGTMANINTALASLKINTGSVVGNVQISVAATVNPVGYFYNGVNGHFYRPISNGTTYTGARAASLLTTFKGQTGYLVTITSASENAFIYSNVPQGNIWFAATDEVKDGTWVIDAGPEKGTIMKTSNGQTAGNIPGVYNNWANGEPNGNNGSENYAVTNWNNQPTWNDLSNNWNNPYIIEYGTWTNPDDATFTEFYTNSVTHSNGEVLTARFNFDFGGNVDETKFSAKANTYTNNLWSVTTNTSRALSGLGKTDITNDLDTTKSPTGTKYINLTPGEIEFCVIYEYDATNKRYRVGLDSRLWQYTQNAPIWNDVKNLKLFDLYNGPVVPNSTGSGDVWWNEYYIYTDTQFDYTNSSYQSNLRNGGGYYALKLASTFTFGNNTSFKEHGIDVIANSQTELNALYNSIVSVSDVYLAFKELSMGGLFGNESGNEFTSGLQYMNADVDGNGVFNESDTYRLLQHLTGVQSLTEYSTLTHLMKLYSKSDYDAITKSNWNTQFNSTRSLFPFSLNTGTLNNTYNVNVTWKGDINLSHSAQQSVSSVSSNSVRTMSLMSNTVSNEVNALIMGELIGNKVIVTVSLDPLQQVVVGTQFQLNYDNTKLKFEKVDFITKGNPTNYGTNRGTFINIGSLITGGDGVLDKTTEYRVVFTPINPITDILGLTSISITDAVNKDGKQLKVKIN